MNTSILSTPTDHSHGWSLWGSFSRTSYLQASIRRCRGRTFSEQLLREKQSFKRARSVPTTPFNRRYFYRFFYRTPSMESVGRSNVENFTWQTFFLSQPPIFSFQGTSYIRKLYHFKYFMYRTYILFFIYTSHLSENSSHLSRGCYGTVMGFLFAISVKID